MFGKVVQWGAVLGVALAFTAGIITFAFDQRADAGTFDSATPEQGTEAAPSETAIRLIDEAPLAVASLDAPQTTPDSVAPEAGPIPTRRVTTVAVLPDGSLSFAPVAPAAATEAEDVPWNEVLLDGSAGETVVAREASGEPWLPANFAANPAEIETIVEQVAEIEAPPAIEPVVEAAETAPASSGNIYRITADALNFHSGPDGDTPTIFQVMGGTEVEVIEWDRGRYWAKIRHTDGQEGWGYQGFLQQVR